MYRVGIIGAGWVAGEHIRAYLNNPETEIVAFSVRRPETVKAHQAEQDFSAEIYTDVGKMLRNEDIDILSICSPPSLHPEHVAAGAEAGCHLVIEKPISLNLDGMKQMQTAVKKAGVKTVVSFVLRWNPLFETIRALLGEDAIGRIFYGEVDYNHGIGPWYGQYAWNRLAAEGGSSLLSAGLHALDGLRWFIQKDVVEVFAYSTNSNNTDVYPGGYEYDPTSITLLKFEDGTLGKVSSNIECIQPYTFPITLQGTGGTIMNNRLYSKKLMPGQTDFATIPTILPDSGDVTHHPFQNEIDHFVDCIQRNVESHTNLAEAIKTHEICYASDLSIKEGQPVKLPLE